MKMSKFSVVIISFFLLNCSEAKIDNLKKIEKQPVLNEKYKIKIQGCAINYNGTNLYIKRDINDWIKVLGNNYRIVKADSYFVVYVFDEIGITIVYHTIDEAISYIDFVYGAPEYIHDGDDLSELPKKFWRDGIQIEDIVTPNFGELLTKSIENKFRRTASTRYEYIASCKEGQKEGNDFVVKIGVGLSNEQPRLFGIDLKSNYTSGLWYEDEKDYSKYIDENVKPNICNDESFNKNNSRCLRYAQKHRNEH